MVGSYHSTPHASMDATGIKRGVVVAGPGEGLPTILKRHLHKHHERRGDPRRSWVPLFARSTPGDSVPWRCRPSRDNYFTENGGVNPLRSTVLTGLKVAGTGDDQFRQAPSSLTDKEVMGWASPFPP